MLFLRYLTKFQVVLSNVEFPELFDLNWQSLSCFLTKNRGKQMFKADRLFYIDF